MNIPRTTLTQTAALASTQERRFQTVQDLDPGSLCVGDLVYTYQGSSWHRSARHVTVYAGGGRLLHAWKGGGKVGFSSLTWLRPFRLHGVYRPMGCGNTRGSEPSRESRPQLRAKKGKPSDDTAVRTVIAQYFRAWSTRKSDHLRTVLWPDAVQVGRAQALNIDQIITEHRRSLLGVRRAQIDYKIESLAFWGDLAIAEVHYQMNLSYQNHRREHDGRRETLILDRRNSQWRISHREGVLGD